MEHEHLVHGLLRKRADVAGQIAVGARVSRAPGPHAAKYGDTSRAVCNVLREATEVMTVRQIAAKVREARGLDADDPEVAATAHKRVGSSLRNLKAREQAESRHGLGLAMVWRLVDP